MGPFKNLISLIKGVDDVNSVYYKDSDRYHQVIYIYSIYISKIPISKERDLEIDTDYGLLKGSVTCSGAGTIEDPLDSYDMILQVWVPSK